MNVLLTCQTGIPYPCITMGLPLLTCLLETVYLSYVPNSNLSSGFRITGPSVATKKNHPDINMYLNAHVLLYLNTHWHTCLSPEAVHTH